MSCRWLALVALALGACGGGEDPAPAPGAPTSRAHRGAVYALFDGGTRRVELVLDEGFPKAALGSRFALAIEGQPEGDGSAGARHVIGLLIDPLKETPDYAFPKEQVLQVSLARGGQPVAVGSVTGFLRVTSRDEQGRRGSAVVSLALHGASGLGLVEIDLTLPSE